MVEEIKLPYVCLKDKQIKGRRAGILQLMIGGKFIEFPATKDGLLECGAYLANNEYHNWIGGSSLDHAGEYSPKLKLVDAREMVRQGYVVQLDKIDTINKSLIRKISYALRGSSTFLKSLTPSERFMWNKSLKKSEVKV